MRHPVLGPIGFECSAFAIDRRTDLSLVIYNPVTREDADRIASLVAGGPGPFTSSLTPL